MSLLIDVLFASNIDWDLLTLVTIVERFLVKVLGDSCVASGGMVKIFFPSEVGISVDDVRLYEV